MFRGLVLGCFCILPVSNDESLSFRYRPSQNEIILGHFQLGLKGNILSAPRCPD
jgi:hypothetical protein